VCAVIPLASASGTTIIGATVAGAGLLLAWLLRMERQDTAAEKTREETDGESSAHRP